jgi:GxxExxY protein
MHAGAAYGIAAPPKSSQIFSQGDREIGRSASERFWFTRRTKPFDATQSAADRWQNVQKHDSWALSERVIAACIEVHRQLGPGLLESIYESALCAELSLRQLPFQRQCVLPVTYKGVALDQTYRADLIVGGRLLVEVKSVNSLLFVHVAQAVTYLRVTGLPAGLIVNFNTVLMRDGLRRVSHHPKISHDSPISRSPCEKIRVRVGPLQSRYE